MTHRFTSIRILIVLTAAALGASACTSFQSSKSVSSPTSPTTTTTPGGTSTGTLVGVWASQSDATVPSAPSAPSASTCSGFQWQISSQSTTAVAGTFSATCDGGVSITANATGLLNSPTTVTINVSGMALTGGVPACSFTLGGTGDINNDTLTIPYSGTTCFGPVHGTETLRRHTTTPAPTPTPDPTPTPAPPATPPASLDAMDLSQAAVYNSPRDIASWPITTQITSLQMQGCGVGQTLTFPALQTWPDTAFGDGGSLQYTVWAVVNINGTWYTSGFIQMWRGRTTTGAPLVDNSCGFARDWAYDSRWGPMAGYQPHVGEQVGFFVSAGNARNVTSVTSVRERSNVVVVALPAGDTGLFTFAAASQSMRVSTAR